MTEPDYLSYASIVVSALLALAALWAAISANNLARKSVNLTKAANELANQAVELTRRAERRRFGEAVTAYYNSRREDLWSGKNFNMPHYTHEVQGVANEVQEPNAENLLDWLTTTIDTVIDPANPNFARQTEAHRMRMTVPIEIGKWIHDPTSYTPTPFVRDAALNGTVQ